MNAFHNALRTKRNPEVGSIESLHAYQAERVASSSPPRQLSRSVKDISLAQLHANPNLICISDRVNEYDRFPFEGREALLKQVLDSISLGNSVLIVGEPGVGRRTLSLGVARTLARWRETASVPDVICSRVVYSLSLGHSFWNRPPGEDVADIQENIKEVFRLVEAAGPEKIVLCIDDVDLLSFIDGLVQDRLRRDPQCKSDATRDDHSGNAVSTENMLRFLLFSKKVVCLCTCIKEAYRRLVASDTFYDEKFSRSFRVLHMQESNAEEYLQVVRSHSKRIGNEVGALILDEAVRAAVAYSRQCMTHRAGPAKALDLLHQASLSAVRANSSDSDHSSGSGSVQRIYFKQNRAKLRPRANVAVRRRFVDELIMRWCGFSRKQLDACLAREELDLLALRRP